MHMFSHASQRSQGRSSAMRDARGWFQTLRRGCLVVLNVFRGRKSGAKFPSDQRRILSTTIGHVFVSQCTLEISAICFHTFVSIESIIAISECVFIILDLGCDVRGTPARLRVHCDKIVLSYTLSCKLLINDVLAGAGTLRLTLPSL
jgi:hypothetical protein